MILLEFFWLLIALGVFFVLKRFSFGLRVLISGIVLLLLSAVTILVVLSVGDPPPEDSVPITQEVLEKEGIMTEEEWEEYKRSVQEQDEPSTDGPEGDKPPAERRSHQE